MEKNTKPILHVRKCSKWDSKSNVKIERGWEAVHIPTNLIVYNVDRDTALFELGKLVEKQMQLDFDAHFGESVI